MKLKIVTIASEIAPFSKSGGLGDVVRSLPKFLDLLGHNNIVITPFYKETSKQDFPRQEIGTTNITVQKKTYHVRFLLAHINAEMPIIFVAEDSLFFR